MSLRVLRRLRSGLVRWGRVVRQVAGRLQEHDSMLTAAGCAFYATLSLFPAITMLIALYGLLFNPVAIEAQLDLLRGLVPPEGLALISRQVHALAAHRTQGLGISLLLSALFTWWSASSATSSIVSALNQAYHAVEQRGYVRFFFTALFLTLAATVCAILALAFLVALPALLQFVHFLHRDQALIHDASVMVMVIYVAVLIAGLYWAGPCIPSWRRHRILPGTIVATVLWLVAALVFTVYVQRIASFETTYGPLAAVAGVMLWFWLSIFATLAGAELNAVLEKRLEPLQTITESVP